MACFFTEKDVVLREPKFGKNWTMNWLLLFLSVSVIAVAAVIIVGRKHNRQGRIMREGRLLKSEMISREGESFYVALIM